MSVGDENALRVFEQKFQSEFIVCDNVWNMEGTIKPQNRRDASKQMCNEMVSLVFIEKTWKDRKWWMQDFDKDLRTMVIGTWFEMVLVLTRESGDA